MSYTARVVHRTPGRLRLQMEGSDLTDTALRETMVQLQSYSMSQRVKGNLLTRTIVLESDSDGSLEKVLDQASEAGVLEIGPQMPLAQEARTPSIRDLVISFREKCDSFLKEVSGNSLDLKSATAWTLAGLGVKQSLSGKFLPAGMTLVIYAMGMLQLDEMDKIKKEQAEA